MIRATAVAFVMMSKSSLTPYITNVNDVMPDLPLPTLCALAILHMQKPKTILGSKNGP